jgi:hypothetical protein
MEKIDIFDVTITVFYAFNFFKVIHKNLCKLMVGRATFM